MNVEIAQRLAELRRERGFSQEGLAEQLGLSRQAVSKWERAESAPDMGNLIALADLYEVTLDELLRVSPEVEEDMRFESQERAESVETEAAAAAEAALAAAGAGRGSGCNGCRGSGSAQGGRGSERTRGECARCGSGRLPAVGLGVHRASAGAPAERSAAVVSLPASVRGRFPARRFLLRLVASGLGHFSHHPLLLLGGEHLGS